MIRGYSEQPTWAWLMLRRQEPGRREDLTSHFCKPQADECQGQAGKWKEDGGGWVRKGMALALPSLHEGFV